MTCRRPSRAFRVASGWLPRLPPRLPLSVQLPLRLLNSLWCRWDEWEWDMIGDRTTARFGVGQPYYARPAFHVSLVSVPGDASEALAPLCEEEDDDGDDDDGGACPPVVVLEVREVECKIGNKLFVIPIGAEFPGE